MKYQCNSHAPRLTGSSSSAFCGRIAASASDGGDFNDFLKCSLASSYKLYDVIVFKFRYCMDHNGHHIMRVILLSELRSKMNSFLDAIS